LGRREDQNILELEIDEIIDESGPRKISNLLLNFLSGALNSFSSRSVSFIAPVKEKRFTDPFLKLLDSSNRNAKMS
jgi:hypothetical protein